VTSQTSIDDREVIFINERCRVDYLALPADVLESADQAIDALQNGRRLPSKMFRSLKGKLAGVDEIRLPYDADTYRVYVYQGSSWVVMVLDAGIKKSTEGQNIPKWQLNRLETRLTNARRYCDENSDGLKSDYDQRRQRRLAFATSDQAGKEHRR
jgi:phage-related protein